MRRFWTSQECEALKLCYRCTDIAVLCAHLDRSRQALATQVYRLDIPERRSPALKPARRRYEQSLAIECAKLGVAVRPALKGRRHKPFVLARARTFASLRRDGFSLPGIGKTVGMNHTTISHAIANLAEYERRFESFYKGRVRNDQSAVIGRVA